VEQTYMGRSKEAGLALKERSGEQLPRSGNKKGSTKRVIVQDDLPSTESNVSIGLFLAISLSRLQRC
jgi:hypothetical protein